MAGKFHPVIPPPQNTLETRSLAEYAYREFGRISIAFDTLPEGGTGGSVAWADITGKPSTFPPSAHNHAASEITSGLIDPARLGTGTPAADTVLYGDNVWRAHPAYDLEGGSASTTYSFPTWDLDEGASV